MFCTQLCTPTTFNNFDVKNKIMILSVLILAGNEEQIVQEGYMVKEETQVQGEKDVTVADKLGGSRFRGGGLGPLGAGVLALAWDTHWHTSMISTTRVMLFQIPALILIINFWQPSLSWLNLS